MELHPDNGAEYFNRASGAILEGERHWVDLSRSRPYQKNDNRFIEQKNDSLVRQYFRVLRLDPCEAVHGHECALRSDVGLYNVFQPVMHLIGKTVVDDKVRRRVGSEPRLPLSG